VLPERRRRGLGRSLIRECGAVAAAWGHAELVLEVEAYNRAALALYEDDGFQELWRAPRSALEVDDAVDDGPPLKRRPDVDHVCMRKPLV